MLENHATNLAEVPLGGQEGAMWHELHGEREAICEALLKPARPQSKALQRQEQLQQRLLRIDNALDRLMAVHR